MSSPLELILFMGLQASGKSTYYKREFYNTHVRINLDMLRTRHRESILFKACLEGKVRTVIDNTNLTKASRSAYILSAKAAKFVVRGYYFESKLEDCMVSNQKRTGAQRIPDLAVISSSRRMELPSYEEGFDELYFVRKAGEGEFITEKWKL
ncbi:MAG TPA: AAA family ATPase [Candidatus Methylacidiphilales bacterium]|nr:AAA family ATPase [Candidatus Methylacidiphilales bacterium]